MGVHIDSEEYERQARRLADHRGTSVDKALTDLLRRELEREGLSEAEDPGVRQARLLSEHFRKQWELLPPEEREARELESARRMEAIRDIQRRVAELPVLDPRPIDEVIYDEDGLPK